MKITNQIREAAIRNRKNKGILRAYREQKAIEAKVRELEWGSLTPVQRLAVLDKRLGKGLGAKRERRRLALS